MTTHSMKSDLRTLALDERDRSAFVAGCNDIIASGEPISRVIDAIRGTRWRFMLTKSGQAIEVEHADDLYLSYSNAIAELKSMHDVIGKEKYEDWVLEAVRDCIRAYERTMLFVTNNDDVADVRKEVDKIFEGTGYRFNYRGIVPEDEDDELEDA